MYENEGTVSGDEDGGLRLESPDLTGSFVESGGDGDQPVAPRCIACTLNPKP